MAWLGPGLVVVMLLLVCGNIVVDAFRGKGPARRRFENLGAVPFVLALACGFAWAAVQLWLLAHPGAHLADSTVVPVFSHGSNVPVDSQLYAVATNLPLVGLELFGLGVAVLIACHLREKLRGRRT